MLQKLDKCMYKWRDRRTTVHQIFWQNEEKYVWKTIKRRKNCRISKGVVYINLKWKILNFSATSENDLAFLKFDIFLGCGNQIDNQK